MNQLWFDLHLQNHGIIRARRVRKQRYSDLDREFVCELETKRIEKEVGNHFNTIK